jgi:hypothetical protein
MSSKRYGTTSVNPTTASSVLVNPETFFPADERGAVRRLGVAENSRPVADGRRGLVGRKHGLDQGDGRGVFGQVIHGAVAAAVEHCVIISGGDVRQFDGTGEARFSRRIRTEAAGVVGLKGRSIASGIDRRLATERGGQRDVGSCILESIIRRSELFEPESRLLARSAERVLCGEDDQYVHVELSFWLAEEADDFLVISTVTARPSFPTATVALRFLLSNS